MAKQQEGLLPDQIKGVLPENIELPVSGRHVTLKQVDQAAAEVVSRSREILVDTALALVIIIAGWVISRWLAGKTQRALLRARVDETFAAFLGSTARYLFFSFAALAAFRLLGLSEASIVALFASFGLAMAFALRNTLSHLASGLMLIVNQPFRVGDFIEVDGQKGTVKRVTVFNTEINSVDNCRLFLPNTKIWESTLINHTYNAQRVVELTLRTGYGTAGTDACRIMQAALAQDTGILAKPEPLVGIDAFEDHGVRYQIRAWVRTKDYQEVRYRLLENLRQALLAEGVKIPDLTPLPPPDSKPANTGGMDAAQGVASRTKKAVV